MENQVEVTAILPTYNEAKNIIPLVNKIHTALEGRTKEILIVDDNSPDRTWELAETIKDKDVRIIKRIADRGLVKSIKEGIKESRGKYVVWMDADLSMPPEVIPLLIDQLENNHVAVGSRYIKGGKDLRPIVRVITSRMINLAANIFLNFKVLDWTTGFVAARREVFETVQLNDSVYGEYCIDFLYNSVKNNFSVKEVPYTFIDRLEGESKTAAKLSSLLRFGWIYGKKILKLKFKNR